MKALIPLATLSTTLLLALAPLHPQQRPVTGSFETSGKRQVTYERLEEQPTTATLILLHGASGPAVEFYQQQARFFARHGYTVLLPHYFEAGSSASPSDENYRRWEMAIESLIAELGKGTAPPRPVFLIGYSLGASVALAVGSQAGIQAGSGQQSGDQHQPIAALAEWYGSLPDSFFYRFRGMPPLLILHGELDRNIPVTDAQQLIRLCKLKELTCENHLYPDQAHGFDAASVLDADTRTLAFFAKASRPRQP